MARIVGSEWLCLTLVLASNPFCKGEGDNGHISTKDNHICMSSHEDCNDSFARRPGFHVGHVEEVDLVEGKRHKIRTRSLKPLLFEIADFLSGSECDHIIELAREKGMEDSQTVSDELLKAKPSPGITQFQVKRYQRIFDKRFKNKFNSVEELSKFIEHAEGIYARKTDVENIFQTFDVDQDGRVSEQELFLSPDKMALMEKMSYLLRELRMLPRYRSRYSRQTWLALNRTSGKLFEDLKQRIVQITNLPRRIVEKSEDLQVVKYSVDGHFHGHYDSTEDAIGQNVSCCVGFDQNTCHLCRYITVLFFLNDVEQGGETAFPVADVEYVQRNVSYNLSLSCHSSRIVIQPKKGTAIMWYNHYLDPKTGLLGKLDPNSLHGGCDVVEGYKWIANSWINLPKI